MCVIWMSLIRSDFFSYSSPMDDDSYGGVISHMDDVCDMTHPHILLWMMTLIISHTPSICHTSCICYHASSICVDDDSHHTSSICHTSSMCPSLMDHDSYHTHHPYVTTHHPYVTTHHPYVWMMNLITHHPYVTHFPCVLVLWMMNLMDESYHTHHPYG